MQVECSMRQQNVPFILKIMSFVHQLCGSLCLFSVCRSVFSSLISEQLFIVVFKTVAASSELNQAMVYTHIWKSLKYVCLFKLAAVET